MQPRVYVYALDGCDANGGNNAMYIILYYIFRYVTNNNISIIICTYESVFITSFKKTNQPIAHYQY